MQVVTNDLEREKYQKEQRECKHCEDKGSFGELDIFAEKTNENEVQEEARCTECMALAWVEKHTLH